MPALQPPAGTGQDTGSNPLLREVMSLPTGWGRGQTKDTGQKGQVPEKPCGGACWRRPCRPGAGVSAPVGYGQL